MLRAIVIVALGLLMAAAQAEVQAPDAARVLAGMRQALGGEAALTAVRAFSVDGMETRALADHSFTNGVEFACILPDRCIKVQRIANPFGGDSLETHGFNGDAQVRRRASNIPYPPDPFANDTPDQKAARAQRTVQATKHEFARLVVPLIGVTTLDGSDVSHAGKEDVDGKTADVLLLRSPDGYEARLFVDAATHLPLMISWMGTPDIVFSTTSTAVVSRGEVVRSTPPSPPFPAGDPSAGLAKVERRLYFSDFKSHDGVNWPRRLKEMVSGRVVADIRLNKFKINPKLDPKRFDPSR